MFHTILTLAAVLATTAAHAQTTIHTTREPESRPPLYKTPAWMPQTGLPPEAVIVALIKPAPLAPVVMDGGKGGSIAEHQAKFWVLKQQGASVNMHAGCWSACTLITAYLPKERLCFAEGSFMAFHSALSADWKPNLQATLGMYEQYPAEIRQWIDRKGGPYKMTAETYWTLYAPELWAMGYPRCKP